MFGRKSKLSKGDDTTRQLQAGGVYSLGHAPHPFIVENDTVDAVKTKKIYSFWSGVWYTTILSLLLFWLPPFGQMIAGYVGGRKAGTPRKGVLAAFIPMSLIFLLFFLRYMGQFVSSIDWFLGLPGAGAEYITNSLPVFGPLFGFMSSYVNTFVSSLWSQDFFIYPYVLTVIFGYVGGILSLQHQRELEAEGKSHPFSPVTIVTTGHPTPENQAPPEESAVPAESVEVPGVTPIAMAKPSKNWGMKKDKKKGKW